MVFVCAFERYDILYGFYDADCSGIQPCVGAYRADFRVADVMATSAVFHPFAQLYEGTAESYGDVSGLAEQVEGKALRRLLPYSRKPRELLDGIVQKFGII